MGRVRALKEKTEKWAKEGKSRLRAREAELRGKK
jgi:hypothetical protein